MSRMLFSIASCALFCAAVVVLQGQPPEALLRTTIDEARRLLTSAAPPQSSRGLPPHMKEVVVTGVVSTLTEDVFDLDEHYTWHLLKVRVRMAPSQAFSS